jgi:hypothetical protein
MVDMRHPLGQYIAGEIRVMVECRRCRHKASFCPIILAKSWSIHTDPAMLPFRCTGRLPDGRRCRCRSVNVMPDYSEENFKSGLPRC